MEVFRMSFMICEKEGFDKEAYIKLLKNNVESIGCKVVNYKFQEIYNKKDAESASKLWGTVVALYMAIFYIQYNNNVDYRIILGCIPEELTGTYEIKNKDFGYETI